MSEEICVELDKEERNVMKKKIDSGLIESVEIKGDSICGTRRDLERCTERIRELSEITAGVNGLIMDEIY